MKINLKRSILNSLNLLSVDRLHFLISLRNTCLSYTFICGHFNATISFMKSFVVKNKLFTCR